MKLKMSLDSRVIRAIISLSLLGYVFYSVGIFNIVERLGTVDLKLFAFAVLVGIFGVVISAKKWQILLSAKDENHNFTKVFRLYYVGSFSNLILPSSLGGDVVKGVSMANEVSRQVVAYASIFMDRFLGLIALLVIASLAILVDPKILTPRLLVAFAIIMLGTLCMVGLLFTGIGLSKIYTILQPLPFDLADKLRRLFDSIRMYRDDPRAISRAFAIALVFHFLPILIHVVLARAMGLDIPIGIFFIMVPVSQVILILPISIHGYGVQEVLYAFFLFEVGVQEPIAVTFSILIQLHGIAVNSLGSLGIIR